MMIQKQNSSVKYTSSSGYSYRGFITLTDSYLIFNKHDEIITKLVKEEISSFQINSNLFTKYISIRVNGKDHKFYADSKSIVKIVNFIKD